jgi:hypothetical protein
VYPKELHKLSIPVVPFCGAFCNEVFGEKERGISFVPVTWCPCQSRAVTCAYSHKTRGSHLIIKKKKNALFFFFFF